MMDTTLTKLSDTGTGNLDVVPLFSKCAGRATTMIILPILVSEDWSGDYRRHNIPYDSARCTGGPVLLKARPLLE